MGAQAIFILVKSFISFMPWGRNDFSLCIQNFSLFFLSVSVQCALLSITTNDMSCHLCPAKLKCSAMGSWIRFVLMVDRWLLILLRRSPAGVPSFPYVLFATDLAAYQKDAVVSVTGCAPKYFIRSTDDGTFKTVGASNVFEHPASPIGKILKPPIGRGWFK
jgi:hypothetical protein